VTGGLCSGALVWHGKNNNGKRLGSGIYFIRYEDTKVRITKKLIMLKGKK